MTVDRQARATLQQALAGYMSGAVRAFAFEDQYWPCRDSPDKSIQAITREVWCIHDELIDHPISVPEPGWEALRRVVAFLGTDLEIAARPNLASWPFDDDAAWRAHEHLVNEFDLPVYDPTVHALPANPWWNRIPSSVGFLVLGLVMAVVFLLIGLS